MPSGQSAAPAGSQDKSRLFGLLALLAAIVGIAVTFFEGLRGMTWSWNTEPEYSHGYLIPVISLYLLSITVGPLRRTERDESWLGIPLVVVGLLAFVFGELSSLYVIVQYGFVLVVWGTAVAAVGVGGVRVIWAALVFLLFMVPLPFFLRYNLTSQLQLISSEVGASILRVVGVPVYLEGNVIDLGVYKLQVVEACAGLRYLFPLMSFGLLSAVLFHGKTWQRWVLFLSSVPIAIFMNSVRIAITGILVNRFGTEAAEGFLHYFEGWVIFTACLVLMFMEMGVLARMAGTRLDDIFDFELPALDDLRRALDVRPPKGPMLAVILLTTVSALTAVLVIRERQEVIPERPSLTTFPLALGEWSGKERTLGKQELDVLQLTDYTMASYTQPDAQAPVELYVAYYESQRKGASVHSPKACLPGGGWKINDFSEVKVPDVMADGSGLQVNRTLISMGEQRMLVYYWFMQRGRNLTNEYLVKWYIFLDSMAMHRTDGALVRLITPLGQDEAPEAGDRRLADFLRAAEPRLYYYIPQADIVAAK